MALQSTNFKLKEPGKETTSIFMLVSFRGYKYKKFIGETVRAKYWNKEKRRAKAVREYPEANDLNERLERMDVAVKKTTNHFRALAGIPDQPDFWDVFDSFYYPDYGEKKKEQILLVDYLSQFIEDVKSRLSPNTMKKYHSTLSRLMLYEIDNKTSIAL